MRNSSVGILLRALAGAALVLALGARIAAAFELPPDSLLRVGGRFEYRIETAGTNAPFPWNYSSRSAGDFSRLMLDLLAGNRRFGELYLKGAAKWRSPRAGGGPQFEFEQGDYFWRYVGARRDFGVRLFANERRYFTGELSTPLLVDGVVTSTGAQIYRRYVVPDPDDQFGLRHDGTAGDVRWTALGAALGERWNEADKFYFLRAGWFGSYVQASAAYYNSSPAPDTLDNHAVVKGELSAGYRRFGLVLSYEQSGFEDSAFFIPSGDSDGVGPGPYEDNGRLSGLDAGAVYIEARMRRQRIGDTGLWSLVYRQRSAGDAFVDPFGLHPGGVNRQLAGLYYAALKKAIDARFEYRRQERTRFDDKALDRFEGMVRAQLANGAEAYLRGAYGEADDELGVSHRGGFVHAAVRRNGSKITTGLHVMLADRDNTPLDGRFGVEARLNFTAAVSLYGRLIASQSVASSDAVFIRLDMRPTDWAFAAVGYGRYYIGDQPYMLEDPDIGRRGETESVWFIRLRGDF
jgi:hypothetical protein